MEYTLDQHAPITTRTVSKRAAAPWFCEEIKKAKAECRRAERRWRKSKLQVHKEMFKPAKNKHVTLIQNLKRNYYVSKFNNVKTCKELFSITDQLLGKRNSPSLPRGNDGDVCSDFSKFFHEKIIKIRNDIDEIDSNPPTYETFKGNGFVAFDEMSENEIKNIIINSPSKSCELDPMPTVLLKQCL